MNLIRLAYYAKFLGWGQVRLLAQQAKRVQRHQNKYEREAERALDDALHDLIRRFDDGKPPAQKVMADLQDILVDHALATVDMGLDTAEDAVDELETRPARQRLAKKPPRVKIPRRPDDLRRFWDKVRRKNPEKMDERVKSIFERTRDRYLETVQSIWEKYGAGWRAGDTGSKAEAVEALKKATKSEKARVRTVIETETTYYYNSTREAYYSQSDQVTHYLFLAVRDHATTKWCRSRHGKVFEKGTVLFQENIPPCHWNCRSEIVPLSPFNPNHKRLIDNMALRATRSNIEPLPPGWGTRPRRTATSGQRRRPT